MINIAFCFDNKVSIYAFNAINSINKNTKSEINYHFIVEKNLPQNLFNRLSKIGKISIAELYDINSYFNEYVKSKAMFFRWLIPEIFDIDKCIYLDVDVILNTDIKKLWDIECKKTVCAVPDCFGHSIKKTQFFQGHVDSVAMFGEYNCDINDKSFLSGQLLMDCDKWRKKKYTERLINFIVKHHTADMMAMNVVLSDDIGKLDYRWSGPAKYLDEHLKAKSSKLVNRDYRDAYLFHYHGQQKPWQGGYANKRLKKLWESYS